MPKILVADDNANIQKMVALAFEERGIQVVSVGNGEAAVRRIPDLAPDLVLADIFMPVRNGYEVCEFVKKDERFSHVPVILLVGAFDPLDEKEARRVGADGVLKKPFVPPDPLIAMVTSALEKNPKVAAEMAKAREAKEVLPEPEVKQLEIPARPEPKPLPEFPEPSAEEAALVYGFGKGVRTLDEQMDAATESKVPVAEKKDKDDEEDEFDAASTTTDWRRNAMDFEVPAEAANKPAFADEHLQASEFPSEADYPPRRVRAAEPVEESQPAVQDLTPAAIPEPPAPEPVAAEPPAVEAAPVVTASIEEPSAPAEKSAASFWSKLWGKANPEPEPQPAPEPQATVAAPEIHEAPAVAQESKSETSQLPAAAHWMDSLAPGQVNATGGDWLDKLSAPQEPSLAASLPAEEPFASEEREVASVQPVQEVETTSQPEVHAAIEAEPQDLPPIAPAANEEQPADEAPAPVASTSKAEAAESWFAPTPSVFDHTDSPVSVPVPVASSQPDKEIELDTEDLAAPVGLSDPDLMTSPAVHVTPEPLLVEENASSQGPSDYISRPQEVPPLYSYFSPASGDRGPEHPAAEEPALPAREEMAVPSFELAASEQSDERIPTAAPPDREALASIPFLNPPPEFRASLPAPESAAAPTPGTVDEVVKKVLERLEPQIHDLLSQGVLKPLVENLLQNELAKKDK